MRVMDIRFKKGELVSLVRHLDSLMENHKALCHTLLQDNLKYDLVEIRRQKSLADKRSKEILKIKTRIAKLQKEIEKHV